MRALAIAAVLAAAVSASGCHCYGSHDRDLDAAADPRDGRVPDPDALCGDVGAAVTALLCPATATGGAPIAIEIEHAAGSCCPATASLGADVDWIDSVHARLRPRWDACECCAACDCIGPTVTEAISLVMPAGALTVAAGDLSCTIAPSSAGDCRSLRSDEWLMPRDLIEGMEIPIGLRARTAAGCSCAPSAGVPDPSGDLLDFRACGCSADACVDPGYEALVVLPARLPSTRLRFADAAGGTSPALTIRDRTVCGPGALPGAYRFRGVEHAGTEPLVRDGDPPLWIRVSGDVHVCCGRPGFVPLVRIGSAGELFVELTTCDDPCTCGPRDEWGWIPWDTDAFVGRHPPGRYRVTVIDPDGVEHPIDVDHR